MANDITPGITNIATSGRTLSLSASAEYNVGKPTTTENRTPIVNFAVSALAFDQMIEFGMDVPAAIDDHNLWEAPDITLRARAVIVECEYGGGGIVINPGTGNTPFPLSADTSLGNGFLIYTNPSGSGLTVGAGATGSGIQKINVSTEVESRFKVYIFI